MYEEIKVEYDYLKIESISKKWNPDANSDHKTLKMQSYVYLKKIEEEYKRISKGISNYERMNMHWFDEQNSWKEILLKRNDIWEDY